MYGAIINAITLQTMVKPHIAII